MRLGLLIAGLMVLGAASAQEAKKKAPVKKQAAHAKATPEQVRKFNELEQKRKK